VTVITARTIRRELRGMRRRRRGHRSVFRRAYDLSDTALYIAMAGGLVTEAVIQTQSTPSFALAPAPHTVASVSWMAVAVALAAVAAVGQALLAIGPIWAGSATQTWILASPVSRRSALLPTFVRTLLIAGMVGAALGGGLSAVYPPWLVNLPWNAVAGFLAGLLLVGVTAELQTRTRPIRWLFAVLMGIAVLMGGVVALQLDVPSLAVPSTYPALVLAVPAVLAIVVGFRALPRLHRGALAAGSDLMLAASVSSTWLDFSLLTSALALRRARRIGRVRSVRLRGSRAVAFVLADLTRLRRFPATIAIWVALLPVPFFAAISLPPITVGPVQLLAAYVAADRFAGGLRTICGSAALRRSLGGTDASLKVIHLVLPTVGAILWCAVTTFALPIAPTPTTVISAAGAVVMVYVMATRPPMDYGGGQFFETGFGAVPVNLIRQLVRGPALLVGLAALQLIATQF
jgi:hypothetical protein